MVNIRLLLMAVLAAVLISLLARVMLTRIETTGVDWVVASLPWRLPPFCSSPG